MATPEGSVYSLADATAVDVAAIERELEDLWRDAAKGDGVDSVIRATAFNLIYQTDSHDDRATHLLAHLTIEHPSRSILLLSGDATETPSQQAWVTAYCHRPNPAAPQICSEFVSLESIGIPSAYVASTLRALLVCGLPVALAISDRVPLSKSVVGDMGNEVQRLICGHMLTADQLSIDPEFSGLMGSLRGRATVTTLTWARIRTWMNRLADATDARVESLPHCSRIIIHCGNRGRFEECLLFAAWCGSRLGWTDDQARITTDCTRIEFKGKRALEIRCADAPGVDIELFDVRDEAHRVRVFTEDDPADDATELLSGELRIWGEDRMFAEAYKRVERWLEDNRR